MKKITTVILAAGRSTRFISNNSKLTQELAGLSIVSHVYNAAKKISDKNIIVVCNKENYEELKSLLVDCKLVIQKSQKGTADAIKSCLPMLKNFNGNVLILSGDVPMIKTETLINFFNHHNTCQALGSLISADLEDSTGYGRIIKNKANQLLKIIEHKDANEQQKTIREINSGIYIFDSKVLIDKIPFIKNDNMQKEYYLPDIFNFMDKQKTSIYKINNYDEISGVNTMQQLKKLENLTTK